jgi:hypothetical protein
MVAHQIALLEMASRMYAVVATANTKCASVIVGVIQNPSRKPKYSGWRTNLYGNGV